MSEDKYKSRDIWTNFGSTYRTSDPYNVVPALPAGVFKCFNSMQGPYLELIAANFTTPFEVYCPRTDIVARVWHAFDNIPKNIGVLLNGIKGTGKTLTAQLICTEAIKRGMPVILIDNEHVNFDLIFDGIKQPVVILLEEWEKIFDDKDKQFELLTKLDGTSDRSNKRLCVFTSNGTQEMQDTFFNRPGRIRYTYQFERLSSDVLRALVAAKVPDSHSHLIPSFYEATEDLEVLSMDTANSLLEEMILFGETAPQALKHMGLTLSPYHTYKVVQVNEEGEVIQTLIEHFTLEARSEHIRSILSGASELKQFPCDINSYGTNWIKLIENFRLPRVFIANIQIRSPWLNEFSTRWLDERPDNWTVPDWVGKVKLTKAQKAAKEDYQDSDYVYGSMKMVKVLIRFERNTVREKFNVVRLDA